MIKTLCIDLDGVLAKFDSWEGGNIIGDPIPGAREFLKTLEKNGFIIIIHTARITCEHSGKLHLERYKKLLWWLKKHNMPYTRIEKKPIATAYIDDNAILCRPQENKKSFQEILDILQCD